MIFAAPPPSILSIAEDLTRKYPLSIVFDNSVPSGHVVVDHDRKEVRVHSSAHAVKAGGQAGWSNHV